MPSILDEMRLQRPVTQTLGNLIRTLDVKIELAGRYAVYASDAREEHDEVRRQLFLDLGAEERRHIEKLVHTLQDYLDDADLQVVRRRFKKGSPAPDGS